MKNSRHIFDSMELLLDAMCNVFGAVLLIAIVIGGVSISQKILMPSGSISPELIKQAEKEDALLTVQLEAARMEYDLLNSIQRPDRPGQTNSSIPAAAVRYQQQIRQANTLADEIERLEKVLQEERDHAELRKRFAADPQKTLLELKAHIAQLRSELHKTAPVQVKYRAHRNTNLLPWRLWIGKKKFWIIGRNSDILQGSFADSDITVSSWKNADTHFFRISKRPEKGRDLAGFSLEKLALEENAAQKYFIELRVEPDAVTQAAGIVAMLRQQNFLYNWQIVQDSAITLRGSSKGDYEAMQ